MKHRIIFLALTLALTLGSLAIYTASDLPVAAAVTNPNCANGPDPSLGTALVTYAIPTAGTYTIWTRLMADVPTNNSYYLQIDCGAPITVGGANLTAGAWSWVNYQNGATASVITATLTAGSHTFNLTGKSPNLIIDRIIFATDPACVPASTGDNCAIAATPSGTPILIVGDANADGKVNVIDLSLLLSHWASTFASTDFNHDGNVNITDLSLLLSHWTG